MCICVAAEFRGTVGAMAGEGAAGPRRRFGSRETENDENEKERGIDETARGVALTKAFRRLWRMA